MTVLTSDQVTHLESTSQNFQLYIAFTSVFQMTATSILYEKDNPTLVDQNFTWNPVVRLGPNRVGICNQYVRFYGGDSYLRGGGAAVNHVWDAQGIAASIYSDGGTSNGAACTADLYWTVPGLYRVGLTVDDGNGHSSTGYRWIRIFQDWEHAEDGIIEVSSLGGSLSGGGWQCQLKMTGPVASIEDRTGVVIYAKDIWDVNRQGVGHEETIGPIPERYDAHVVMTGYVVGDTVEASWDTNSVTFQVKTPEAMLQNTSMYMTDFWSTGQNGHGHFIDNLTFADAIQHMLTEHTNFATFHDIVVWQQTAQPNILFHCTLNEGSIWSWIQDMAKNEFGRAFCDKNSSLYIVPDVNFRGFEWWGNQGPPMMDFNEDNVFQIQINEQPANRIGFVRINGLSSKGNIEGFEASYPATPGTVGSWEIVGNIVCDNQLFLNKLAARVYAAANARYSAQVVTGLNHALDINQIVTITYTSKQ